MICASIMAALRGGLLLAFVKINDKINIWTKTNITVGKYESLPGVR